MSVINGLDRQYLNIMLRAGQETVNGALKAADEGIKLFKQWLTDRSVVQKNENSKQPQGKPELPQDKPFVAPTRPQITN